MQPKVKGPFTVYCVVIWCAVLQNFRHGFDTGGADTVKEKRDVRRVQRRDHLRERLVRRLHGARILDAMCVRHAICHVVACAVTSVPVRFQIVLRNLLRLQF